MKKLGLIALFVVALAGISFAQGLQNVDQVAAEKTKNIALGDAQSRYGTLLWTDGGTWAWWSGVDTGYINLDWATFGGAPATGLNSELIDGFGFAYGTNNMDPAGETFAVYYFDDCTGWGNLGVQQTGFLFTGLPNGYGLPTLPPGWGWIWTITVDLEGSGYEFPLNDSWGEGISRWSVPTMGGTGLGIAFGGVGSENAFDIYYPSGVYNGTWWFGSANWATFCIDLYGPGGPAAGMTYYGMGAQGNDADLHTYGSWASTSGVHYVLKNNGQTAGADVLVASLTSAATYMAPYDITKLVGAFAGGSPWGMTPDTIGTFSHYNIVVPAAYYGVTAYFQGFINAGLPVVDASQGVNS